MKRKQVMIIVAIAIAIVGGIAVIASSPTKCPFVNPNTGLECLGVPMPDGVCVAGSKWKCLYGHTWITND
jgi:hypothetical protein